MERYRANFSGGFRRWWPLLVWAMVAAMVVAWVAFTAAKDRSEAMALAETRSRAMAELAAEHVGHLYDSADAALKLATPLFTKTRDWSGLDGDKEAWLLLRDLGRAQPSVPSLFMADETGKFRMHAMEFPAPAKTISGRDYFQRMQSAPSGQPFVTEPVVGMVLGAPTLILARRLDYGDGRFAGIVGANVNASLIAEFFATLGAGEGGIVNLQRTDGLILVRHPALDGAVGSKVDNAKAFPAIAEGKRSASAVTRSPLDGVERITSFHRLKRYDLLVLSALPVDEVLAPWRRGVIRLVAIIGCGIVVLTWLFLLLLRRYHAESEALAQLRESQADLIQVQQVARLGHYVYDMRTDRWESSAILDDIFGIDADYVRTGVSWLGLVAPSQRWAMTEYLGEIQAGSHDFDREYPILRHCDGAERWVHGQGRIERDAAGKPIRLVGAIRDVTDRKAAEMELKAKAEELVRSNTELEQFAYVASHDLREPLRMVSSYVDLLDRRYGDKLDDSAREFIAFARDGAKRMDRLVLDLLEYSRIGRVTKPMAAVPLDKALDRALKTLALKIEEAGAEIIRPEGPSPILWGDMEELTRLFQNLIGNAIKYRAPDRKPVIRLTQARDKEAWEIAVEDNGIGIDPQYFDRIFLIFHRLHRRGEYEGTGIGLSICKKIVERHGGQITVESKPGEGSVFRVRLPAAVEQ